MWSVDQVVEFLRGVPSCMLLFLHVLNLKGVPWRKLYDTLGTEGGGGGYYGSFIILEYIGKFYRNV
jgi:hypothetical protein